MEFLLNEIEQALNNQLYMMVFQTILTLPDICAALVSDNGETSKSKYIDWFNTYYHDITGKPISGEDCYYFRCSIVHQAKPSHFKSSYSRVMFILPNQPLKMHNCIFNDALLIDIKEFSYAMINSVRNWLEIVKNDDNFKKNYPNLITFHPNGIEPFISGAAMIG